MRDLLRLLVDLVLRFTRTLDLPLCLTLGALMVIGLMVMHSAGAAVTGTSHLMLSQSVRFAFGLVIMWCLSRVPVPRLRAWSPLVYVFSMVPLMVVFILGTGKYGRQWLDLKLFYLQPAELLKISLPMMMAWYLHRMPLPPRLFTVMVSFMIIGIPTSLIMLQPDFGTSVLVAASGVFVLLLAGLPWWWIGIGVVSIAMIAPFSWFWLLRPYQKDRIMMFLNPENDTLGAGWNIIQSKIAIGSGGWPVRGGALGRSHI